MPFVILLLTTTILPLSRCPKMGQLMPRTRRWTLPLWVFLASILVVVLLPIIKGEQQRQQQQRQQQPEAMTWSPAMHEALNYRYGYEGHANIKKAINLFQKVSPVMTLATIIATSSSVPDPIQP